MRLVATAALFALATLAVPFAQASDASPVGLWKAIDDTTGKPTALIRITEERGELRGKIEQLFRAPGEDPNPKCTLCSDARKDQPILGMTIVSGLKKDGDEYKDGEILDPNNGKIYKSKLSVHDGGKKVEVRGYVGVPMFGRSQVWLRQE
jgi:uncharacterized protein (DUF2147 family)